MYSDIGSERDSPDTQSDKSHTQDLEHRLDQALREADNLKRELRRKSSRSSGSSGASPIHLTEPPTDVSGSHPKYGKYHNRQYSDDLSDRVSAWDEQDYGSPHTRTQRPSYSQDPITSLLSGACFGMGAGLVGSFFPPRRTVFYDNGSRATFLSQPLVATTSYRLRPGDTLYL
ncbi:uncharacterized protein IL334_000263 [Kwoniella shivajii]|uniref:Uncharacterized protein n=1 Tax=Kwoniella shivajii TaxID=564305 RepID=A0ABZ1CP86_9TREE|nr:hypothetical protein IL334_000263 [Kwoniella shivajii]